MAVDITECVNESGIWIHIRPRKRLVRVVTLSLVLVRNLVLISSGTKAVLIVKIDGVCSTLYGANRARFKGKGGKEKGNQEKGGNSQDPIPNLPFFATVLKSVALHITNTTPNPLILFATKEAFNSSFPLNEQHGRG